MPFLEIQDTRLFYQDTGPQRSGETIVFSHGLLFDHTMFAHQVRAFRDRYRCIAYDHRGQGQSADDFRSNISMEVVYKDAASLIETLKLGRVHFCGLSMGGFVGLRLAARRPDLIRSLIVLNSSAEPEARENVFKYRVLATAARVLGARAVMRNVAPILFAPGYLRGAQHAETRAEVMERLCGNRRSIWRAVNGVIDRPGVADELASVRVPTLVVAGEQDRATPPTRGARIHAKVAGSMFVTIPSCGHSSTLEQPERVNELMGTFLSTISSRIVAN